MNIDIKALQQEITQTHNRYRPLQAVDIARAAHLNAPEKWAVTQLYLDSLKRLSRFDECDTILKSALESCQNKISFHVTEAQIRLAQDDYDACADALERARGAGLDNARYYAQSSFLARASGDVYGELAFLKALMDMSDISDVTAHFRYAARSLDFGNIETASNIQRDLSRRRPHHRLVKRLTARLLATELNYDALSGYVNEWGQSDRLVPADIPPLQRLWLETRLPAVFETVKSAIMRWPFSPALRYSGLQMGLIAPLENASAVLKRPLEKLPPFLAAEEAWYMAKVGHIEEAQKLVQTLNEHWPRGYDTHWDEHTPALLELPTTQALKRTPISHKQNQDWVLTKEGTQKRLTIVMAALYGDSFIPRNLLDRYFAALGQQVLYIRDDSVTYYMNGVQSRGPDLDATVEALRHEIDKVGAENTTLIALSASGFQGVRLALSLGIPHVVQLGPLSQTGVLSGVLMGDERGIAVRARTDHLFRAMGDTIAPDLYNAPDDFTVDVFYSPYQRYERTQVAKLRPFSCVNIWRMDQIKEHNVMSYIFENNALQALLDRDYVTLRERLQID